MFPCESQHISDFFRGNPLILPVSLHMLSVAS